MEIKELLEYTINKNASDLHLLSGVPPMIRINGVLLPITGKEILTAEETSNLVFSLVNNEQKEILLVNKELDFSFDYQGQARFRINAYYQKSNLAAALRLIPNKIPKINELNMPEICHTFTQLKQGFILITGPTGQGKSTTLASIIDEVAQTRPIHIVTIEDPIEYLFTHQKAIVSQREIRADTHSWQIALRSCLREDPDVVMIGEMRDYETIASALTIAETGHLVFATLHTNSAAQTINRIIDVFPANQQDQIKTQLSSTLEAIISQRLLPSLTGGRIPATEILVNTPAISNAVREGKSAMIDTILQTSAEMGMRTLEMDLARLVKERKVDLETARAFALRPEELMRLTKG
ncbi:MAG: type IV pilus twitching motility protein PilT [Candidatus Shapirobacteria bacterium]|nr:type IV pilus twitching motility protein PilT [Candidatus Shapirobacteria bacterium]